MCGIFAYVGYESWRYKSDIVNTVIKGLKKLEYRGYDSTGMAILNRNLSGNIDIEIVKTVGDVSMLCNKIQQNIENLSVSDEDSNGVQGEKIKSFVTLGHTRWATHGEVVYVNCHPIMSTEEKEFVVIHNGVITNYKRISDMLKAEGYEFETETDTEVLVKLALYMYRQGEAKGQVSSFSELMSKVVAMVEGASAFVMVSKHYPDEVAAFKRGSPLILGIKSYSEPEGCELNNNVESKFWTGEKLFVISSDTTAIVDHSRRVLYLEDGDMLHIDARGQFKIFSSHNQLNQIRQQAILDSCHLCSTEKDGYDEYMLKEIYEQQQSVVNAMRGRVNFEAKTVTLGGIKLHVQNIVHSRRILLISCGSSHNAAIAVRPIFEKLIELPVVIENASDFLDRLPPIYRDDTCVFISQSGETADTIQALNFCKSSGALCVGIVNQVGSSISRLTDCGIHMNSGPEIAVAATKCYTSQIVVLILLAIQLGQDKISTFSLRSLIFQHLSQLSSTITKTLALSESIKNIARLLLDSNSLLLLGRGYQTSVCLEGALKLKEISYIHAEGINSGEIKHGPLALVEYSTSIIMIVTHDSLYEHSFSSLQQILARNGQPIVICSENDSTVPTLVKHHIAVPHTIDCLQPIINVIPLQLLSYYMAHLKGLNIDRPRNLAKCVTIS